MLVDFSLCMPTIEPLAIRPQVIVYCQNDANDLEIRYYSLSYPRWCLLWATSARTYAMTNPPSCDTLACSFTGPVVDKLAFAFVNTSEGFEWSPNGGRNDKCFQFGRNMGYRALYAASLIAHLAQKKKKKKMHYFSIGKESGGTTHLTARNSSLRYVSVKESQSCLSVSFKIRRANFPQPRRLVRACMRDI